MLDLADGPVAAVARHLAELGADVLRIELPGIDRTSLDYAVAHVGKRLLPADADLERWTAESDIVIENGRLDGKSLAERHPRLVVLSMSDFGRSGRFARWQATDPVLHALSGELSRSGISGNKPLLPPWQLGIHTAVAQAVTVVLIAYVNRVRTGRGDWLDFSLLEGTAHALDPGYGIAGSATAGVPPSKLPRGRPEARFQYPIIPCKDGHVRICVLAARQWRGMFEWMGRPEEFADPSFDQLRTRFGSPTLIPAIAAFFADKTRAELEKQGQRFGVPTGAVLNLSEAVSTEQVIARETLRSVEISPGRIAPLPCASIEVDGVRAELPALSQVPAEGWKTEPVERRWGGSASRPLQDVRVLDLGVIVVGAETGRLLADQGAVVIKVENAAYPDGSRQTLDGAPISLTMAAGHRNKLGLGINLRSAEGRELLLRLAAKSDVILSNFKPGTLDSLGLSYQELRRVNPGIVWVESSAYGSTGPWSARLGYGPLVRASTGLTEAWSYPGDANGFSDALTVYPDHAAARFGASAALALLIRRLRTGEGGCARVAQADVIFNLLAVPIAAAGLGEALPAPDAPWGVFAARGDDEWCVVTVRDDADWARLSRLIGMEESGFVTKAGRVAGRDRIDAALTAWLARYAPHEAMRVLQDAGIPAAVMLRVPELPSFDFYRDRGFFREVSHPRIDEPYVVEAAPVKSRNLPEPPETPAPLFGEHTTEIARSMIGLSDVEITRLIETGILEVAKEMRE